MIKIYNYRCENCGGDHEEYYEKGEQPEAIQCCCIGCWSWPFNFAQNARAYINDERQGDND